MKQSKQGMVVIDTFNNDADAVMLALSCSTAQFSKSMSFTDLIDTMLLNAMHQLPPDADTLMGLEIQDNKFMYPDCDFIFEAVNKIADENEEEINVEFYHLERLGMGRNFIRIFGKSSPDGLSGAMLSFGGTGMARESALREGITDIVDPILNQIIVTDPLALYEKDIPQSVIDHLKNYYKKQFVKEGKVTYYNKITGTVEEHPLENEHKMYLAVEQKLDEFKNDNILYFQPFPMIEDPNGKNKLYDYVAAKGLYIFGDMIRFSLK